MNAYAAIKTNDDTELKEYLRLRAKYRSSFRMNEMTPFSTYNKDEAEFWLSQAHAIIQVIRQYKLATSDGGVDQVNNYIIKEALDGVSTLLEHAMYEMELSNGCLSTMVKHNEEKKP